MDPTIPEFRPQALAQPTDEPRPDTSEESQWRTTCRTCGEKFKSRNQLMRHLYKSHPGKPAKSKASPKATQPRIAPQSPVAPKPGHSQPHSQSQSQSRSRVHPFALLSYQQQVAFAGHVLFAIFSIGMKQLEEEGKEQQQRERHQEQLQNHGALSLQGAGDWKPQKGPTSATPGPEAAVPSQASPDRTPSPDQISRGKPENGAESEDSDDEDGGVALFGPAYGDLPFRPGEKGNVALEDSKGACELDYYDWDLS
ncbi:hypothetical protein L209DRAFT_753736 [Thermothelomyces heterothallicus CBS 203.75]